HIHLAAGGSAGRPGLDEMAAALKAGGMTTRILKAGTPPEDCWPALAEMSNGQVVLVLCPGEEGVEVYDPTAPDMRAEVPMDQFLQVYAGRILQARATVADLEARHVEKTAAPHWFW